MALNPNIQEKLYQEMRQFQETHYELSYERINDLNYMDCVLNETFSKWAAALVMDRVANKEYILPPSRPDGKTYRLKPGDAVYCVVNSIHMDLKYHPNPHLFDPERFSEENKQNLQPFTFFPFGMGPRAYIGSRFALLELKVLLYYILLNFKVLKCKKTLDPIKLAPSDFNIRVQGGTWVMIEQRI